MKWEDFEKEKDYFLHRAVGFLNFVGGNYNREMLKEKSFEEVVDDICRNGGGLDITMKESKLREMNK